MERYFDNRFKSQLLPQLRYYIDQTSTFAVKQICLFLPDTSFEMSGPDFETAFKAVMAQGDTS
ncbi:hypothetical protein ACFL6B_00670 [Thermodesulfobacteriota bacterium]